jgi:Fur family iron response transcriptional regulator
MSAYSFLVEQIISAGLRPTRQRLALAKLLFGGEDRHVTAETLHLEAQSEKVKVSLATVYNTLHQFTSAGLLREISVDGVISIDKLPSAPEGTKIKSVDVVVTITNFDNDNDY